MLGEVNTAFTEAQYMSEDRLNSKKINPLTFTHPDNKYWTLGEMVADAFNIGKKIKK